MRRIVYVDDNTDDLYFMSQAFRYAKLAHELVTFPTAEEAMHYLGGDPTTNAAPELVITDLNMPRVSGFELLRWIRNTPATAALPVVVLTTSSLESDHERAVACGATGYAIKPPGPRALAEVVTRFIAGAAAEKSS